MQLLKKIVGRALGEQFLPIVRQLWLEVGLARNHSKALRRAKRYAGKTGLKLQLGCGPLRKAGWVNIDIYASADLTLDLRRKLPFANNSCAMIYSEHVLEHFDYPKQTNFLLQECYRVLQSGGVFSVGVPDAEWPLRSYCGMSEPDHFQVWKSHDPSVEGRQTRLQIIDYHFRQDGDHKTAYDWETLHHVLERNGYTNITQREFDPSLDSETRRIGTLYVQAVKPMGK